MPASADVHGRAVVMKTMVQLSQSGRGELVPLSLALYTAKGHNPTFFRPVAVSLYRRVGLIQGHP